MHQMIPLSYSSFGEKKISKFIFRSHYIIAIFPDCKGSAMFIQICKLQNAEIILFYAVNKNVPENFLHFRNDGKHGFSYGNCTVLKG